MAFEFIVETGFEDGTLDTFSSETDTTSKLDFPHYSELAAIPGLPGPYRGAFCMRVDLAVGTTNAFVTDITNWDSLTAGVRRHTSFKLFVSSDITMANNDEFAILQLIETGAAIEVGIFINFTTANGLRIGIGETGATQFLPLTTNVWHHVNLNTLIDDGGGNNGTIDLSLDGGAATQVAGVLDQNAITSGRIGVVDQDASTTAGVLLFDEFIIDDGEIFPTTFRFPVTQLLTVSGHAFVGPGRIEDISLMAGGATNNVLSIFDTDRGNTNDASKIVAELKGVTTNSELVRFHDGDIQVQRGCFVSMTGTNPRALIKIKYAPAYGSDGAIRTAGRNWKPTPGNV